MRDVLYRKIGRRYKAVAEYDSVAMDALPEGAHLIVVQPGVRSTRCNVNPDHAGLLAAFAKHRDMLCGAVRKASELKPRQPSNKQKQAWAAYCKVMGTDVPIMLEGSSINDIVTALEQALLKEVNESAAG